jgi:hypothetical protein
VSVAISYLHEHGARKRLQRPRASSRTNRGVRVGKRDLGRWALEAAYIYVILVFVWLTVAGVLGW